MASNMKRRQFASSEYAQIKAQQLSSSSSSSSFPSFSSLKSGSILQPSLQASPSPSQSPLQASQIPVYDFNSPIPVVGGENTSNKSASSITSGIQQAPMMTPSITRMGISIPQMIQQASQQQQQASQQQQQASPSINVKCLMGRTSVYQPLPNLQNNNFVISCTGFARAMRNHIWGEHVFMFEKIQDKQMDETDWSKWAACADTHATADEWLEVILPGFELNGVVWFIVRGIDPDSGSIQFYFCPRNDPRGNPILGEFGSMPRFDISQISIVDGQV